MRSTLKEHTTPPARVRNTPEGGFILEISDGAAGEYRLAQLDDYHPQPRSRFIWQQQTTFNLRARVSNDHHPGTWGFGLWNDPFSISLGLAGGMARRLPALPNSAWFFFASPENHLSFRDDKPAQGFLAQTISAPHIPSLLLALFLLGIPLLAFHPFSKLIRAVASSVIREDSCSIGVDVTQWHDYKLKWGMHGVDFAIDGKLIFSTEINPKGSLGLVIWIDNQYAAWKPDGSLGMGALANPPAWLEIADLDVTHTNKAPE